MKFFSSFGNLAGVNETELELPDGATLREVVDKVLEEFPQLEQFARYMIMSLNNRVADPGTAVKEGDVVGVMPPLGGG